MLSKVLGLTTAIGVTLAIVRKGRDLVWSAIGVVLILKRGFSLSAVQEAKIDEPHNNQPQIYADERRSELSIQKPS